MVRNVCPNRLVKYLKKKFANMYRLYLWILDLLKLLLFGGILGSAEFPVSLSNHVGFTTVIVRELVFPS